MSTHKSKLWCVMKECNYNVTEKRHFFMFPEECDRWLQWIHACGRFDLQAMGPEYAHRNYRLCHLHFEEKWYKIGKCRASLLPNAVPTIFFGRNNTSVTSFEEENITEKDEDKIRQEEMNSDIQSSKPMPIDTHASTYLPMDKDIEMTKPSTSKTTHILTIAETPKKKKLQKRNLKLTAENKKLRERIRRLQKKIQRMENTRKISAIFSFKTEHV